MAVGQLSDRAHLAAVLGRPDTLALGHAARAQLGSRHGLVALASPSVMAPFAAPAEPAACGSLWPSFGGSVCITLVPWVVLMDSTWWARMG